MILSDDIRVFGQVHDYCAQVYAQLNTQRKQLCIDVSSPSSYWNSERIREKLQEVIAHMDVELLLDPAEMLSVIREHFNYIDAISLNVIGQGPMIRHYTFSLWVRKNHRQTMMYLGCVTVTVHLTGTPCDYILHNWATKCDSRFNQLFPAKYGVKYAYIDKPNIFHIRCRF